MSLEDVDLVPLDGVQVVVHGQEDLRKWKGLITVERLNLNSTPHHPLFQQVLLLRFVFTSL